LRAIFIAIGRARHDRQSLTQVTLKGTEIQRRGAMTKEGTPKFNFEDLFGDDYYYFYELLLTAERTKREAEAVWKLLALEPGRALLDLGCGHGRMANALAELGASVTGLDASPYLLEIARKDAASRRRCHLYRGRHTCDPVGECL
jgi:2-polyprenyl-3-methyl-5-hydroxy-6-metoxy-1,4-benzoquinol methylase